MDSEATCPTEAVADSVVDGACTAPQAIVPHEIASSKPVSNVDEEAVAFFDDDLDTEFNTIAFMGIVEHTALRSDNGHGSNEPSGASNLETAEARIKELEGQLFHQRSESWKRETGICNAFRKCAEGLDQANKTIADMKTELEKKAKEPTTSVDAKEKELAERAAECEKLKEQLKQEKEQSIDLARKVGQLRQELATARSGRKLPFPRVPTLIARGADTVYPLKRSRWEPNGNCKRYWNVNVPLQSQNRDAAKRPPLCVTAPSNAREPNDVTDLEDGEILIDNDNNNRSPSPKRQSNTSNGVDVMKSRVVTAKQIV